MKFSKQTIEILLDLVEIKISAMQVHDREDARELLRLRTCRNEILSEKSKRSKKVIAEVKEPAPRSRPYTAPSQKPSLPKHS